MGKMGIFCVEGGWSSKLTDNDSVLPLLTFIRGNGDIPFIHRYVESADALALLLRKWTQKQYANYSLGYFGFHGAPGAILLGPKRVSLRELAEMLGDGCAGKVLYFGSCAVLDADEADLASFVKATGLRAIAGYSKDVDWFESAAFDLMLFDALVYYSRPTDAEARLRKRAPELIKNLGFQMVHSAHL